MRKVLFAFTIMLLSGFMQAALCAETVLGPENVPRMTKEQLKAQLGNSDIVIIDVRTDHDWQDSNTKIKGAVREDPSKLDSWIKKYAQDKTIILYCA
jgi:predicted sulfurtransferase